jgi:hypothetical protein
LASRSDRFIPGETTPRAIEYEAGWAPKPVCTFWIRVKFLTYVTSVHIVKFVTRKYVVTFVTMVAIVAR